MLRQSQTFPEAGVFKCLITYCLTGLGLLRESQLSWDWQPEAFRIVDLRDHDACVVRVDERQCFK